MFAIKYDFRMYFVRCFDISSMQDPPPLPRKKSRAWLWILLIIGGLSIARLIGGIVAYRSISAFGITRSFDNKFGDQHLKTAVALIELHKVRFARYPDSLRDLKFTGEWDQIALMSVRYYPSAKRDAYYIVVERRWMGKPTFTMPPEFWSGREPMNNQSPADSTALASS
jgi:hypothetical protein